MRRSELDPKLRELAILRVGALCRSHYEVFQHRQLAAQAGLPQNKIDLVSQSADGTPDLASFTQIEADVIRFTESVVRDVKAPAPLFEALAVVLSHKQLLELMMAIGFYMMVSRVLENLEVELEDPPVVP